MKNGEIIDKGNEKIKAKEKKINTNDFEEKIRKTEFKKEYNDLQDEIENYNSLKKIEVNYEKNNKIREKEIIKFQQKEQLFDIRSIDSMFSFLENISEIDKHIPKEYRITQKEYKDALVSKEKKEIFLQKIDSFLTYSIYKIKPSSKLSFSRFSVFTTTLHPFENQKIFNNVHDAYVVIQNSLNS